MPYGIFIASLQLRDYRYHLGRIEAGNTTGGYRVDYGLLTAWGMSGTSSTRIMRDLQGEFGYHGVAPQDALAQFERADFNELEKTKAFRVLRRSLRQSSIEEFAQAFDLLAAKYHEAYPRMLVKVKFYHLHFRTKCSAISVCV